MIFATALRLAAENRRLRDHNERLAAALALANATSERLTARCGQLHRDADLLALMAKDRPTALALLRDAHGIDQLEERGMC